MMKKLKRIFCRHIWKDVEEESLGTVRRRASPIEWATYERTVVTQECVKCREIRFIEKSYLII